MQKLNHVKDLPIGNHVLNRVETFNHLGVIVDSELRFENALMSAYGRFSQRLYTLSIIRKDLTRKAAISIVKSVLIPYFDYMVFLSNSCTDKVLTKTKRLVNRSLRIALNVNSRT